MILRKSKGKSKPITIDSTVRTEVRKFRDDLVDSIEIKELGLKEQLAIRYILTQLEPYDRNILFLYYSQACSCSTCAKMLGVTPTVVLTRIKKITQQVQKYIDKISNKNKDL